MIHSQSRLRAAGRVLIPALIVCGAVVLGSAWSRGQSAMHAERGARTADTAVPPGFVVRAPGDEPNCPGDADGDRDVDLDDLTIVLQDFGCVSPPEPDCPGDLDADGDTDLDDLTTVLQTFGD